MEYLLRLDTGTVCTDGSITGAHSKLDQILLLKIGKYIGFSVYHRFYLLWPPIIVTY